MVFWELFGANKMIPRELEHKCYIYDNKLWWSMWCSVYKQKNVPKIIFRKTYLKINLESTVSSHKIQRPIFNLYNIYVYNTNIGIWGHITKGFVTSPVTTYNLPSKLLHRRVKSEPMRFRKYWIRDTGALFYIG